MPPRKPPTVRNCDHCGKEYVAKQEFAGYQRRFCSQKCAGEANREATIATYPPREEIEQLYCVEGLSDKAIGARYGHTYTWARGVRDVYGITSDQKAEQPPSPWLSSHGYVRIGDEYEHRLVMQKKIGRPLLPGEAVHHVDKDKANNHPDNLILYSSNAEHIFDERGRRAKNPKRKTKRDRRNWTDPLQKVEDEGRCRVCGRSGIKIDAAHIIARSRTMPGEGEDVDNIVPLCAERCHPAYDQRQLDLLPFLTLGEQAKAVELCDGLLQALRRITGQHWEPQSHVTNDRDAGDRMIGERY